MTDLLGTPLRTVLAGGASKVAKAFDYHTVEDLLRHFPRRYQRLDTPTPLSQVQAGEHTTILARVVSFTSRPMRQRRGFVVNVSVTDDVGTLPLTFFAPGANVLRYWEKNVLREGQVRLFDGRAEMFRGKLQLTHPRILEFDPLEDIPPLLPIYPATKGLDTMRIRRGIRSCLAWLSDDAVPDPIPSAVAKRRGLPPLHVAFRLIHEPGEPADHRRAMDRFRYEEALAAQTALVRRRVAASLVPAIPRRAQPGGLVDVFDEQLPFQLTDGQREVGAAISEDLAKTHPMHRLLQGEVGSGKTVVALRAMLAVVAAGGQAALLAPTEVLALQHFRTISGLLGELGEWTNPDGVRVAVLTGAMGAAARRNAVGDIGTGHAGIVVGTHALLSEAVQFADLGLVVVDEQHRFGVEQRDALRDKAGQQPHLLVMTATPIPRTVAMTVFGDLEVSTLTEIPAGRADVATHVVDAANEPWMTRIWQRVAEEVAAGRQTFVVCARVGPQDEAEALLASALADSALFQAGSRDDRALRGVLEVAEDLRAREELGGLRIEVVYGRQPSEERDHLMRAFAAGQVDVLVATTVIEVGVDMPGASMMVVFDADRFGVSQLHQLRGRIGRGAHPGLCLLVDGSPAGSAARERLDAVAATTDGFQLAEVDLQLRREGDVLGAAQSGAKTSLRLLRVARDAEVISQARDDAFEIVGDDVGLAGYPALRALIDRLFDPEREAFFDRA